MTEKIFSGNRSGGIIKILRNEKHIDFTNFFTFPEISPIPYYRTKKIVQLSTKEKSNGSMTEKIFFQKDFGEIVYPLTIQFYQLLYFSGDFSYGMV
jgi:hypothetical protein